MKYKALDGLRGIGAFAVYLNHFFQMFFNLTFDNGGIKWVERPPDLLRVYRNSPFAIINHGYFWVVIFFMLSGFVLPLKYFQSGKMSCVTGGIFRRYPRMMLPVLMTYTTIYTVIRMKVTRHDWPFPARDRNLQQVIADSLFGVWMGQNDYFSATWTIGIELFASYVVYMVAVMMMHTERPRVVLSGIIALLMIPQITDAYEITHYNVSKFQFHLPIFLVGTLLSYSEAHPEAKGLFDKIRNWGYLASGLRNTFLFTLFFVYGSNTGKFHCEHLRDGDCTFWVRATLNWQIPQMFSLYVAALAIIVLTLVSETV